MSIGARIKSDNIDLPSEINLVSSNIDLDEVILSEDTKNSILDFLSFKSHEDLIYKTWGLDSTHGNQKQNSINLYGAPGTGKTMAAQAIANSLGNEIILVDYSSLESKYVGETSKNITNIFKFAEDNNAVIFFDEADAVLSKRVTDMSSSTDVSVNQTRSVLLTLMNNHKGTLIFATNFIENFDPAFMRRISSHIHFSLPDKDARHKLWVKYIPDKLPCIDLNMNILIEESEGLSGSDISNAVKKTALSAARNNQLSITNDDFIKSIRDISNSKKANTKQSVIKTERFVSEDYAKSQINQQ